MWQFLSKILGTVGKKVASKAATKAATKVAEEAGKKGVGGVVKAIQGASELASSVNPQSKSIGSKILNVATGDLGKNFASTGSTVGRAGELPKGAWFNKVKSLIVGDLDEAAKSAKIAPKLDEFKGTKMGQIAQNALGGETFGSKMFLNTVANLGKQGAFSGSDVGQPDKSFGGMLANSLASSLGTSAMQQREQNYTYRQNLLNMASDVNISEDIYKAWSEPTLKEINGFKSQLVDMMYNNRKRGISGLTSEDMLKASEGYINVKKKIDNFNTGLKSLNEATQIISKDPKQTWDIGLYNKGVEYFRQTGRPPADGFLIAAPKDPRVVFPEVRITPLSQWSKATPENGFMRMGQLTDEQRQLEAVAQLQSNMGVRKYAESIGLNPDDRKDQIKFAMDYYQYIEQPQKDEYAEALYQDKMERKQERAEDRAMSNAKDMPYNVTGNSVVFKKNTTENVPVSELRTITGGSYEGDEDELLPVVFENIDAKGNLTVAAKEGRGSDAKTRRYVVPPAKAKGLVESYYPGVWSNVEKMYKAPKEPVGVEKMFDLPGYGKFTASELRKQGWSDEDIKRLR